MRTKVLFINSNETFVDKVIFYPGIITYLGRIVSELDYELVLVSNQVNLGTESFPRVLFHAEHDSILKRFEGEGIHLSSIDFYKENHNSVTEMLPSYFSKTYDRSQSFVIGDSIILLPLDGSYTTEEIALHPSWKKIYNLLKFGFSEFSSRRISKETEIQISIKINGKGISDIHTGYGFLDHILDQICIHANIDLGIKVKGDVHVDEHHSIEDTAIALGIALSKSLKDKRGMARYGFLLPMDDILVQVALDLGGRSNLIWKADFEREKIGDIPTEMFAHFFKSFSDVAYCNLHFQTEGNNEHHKIEAIFKAFAYVLKIALTRNHNNELLPSTKEIL
ncbi:imidazole glycerol-phosphate dehydratase/histidinol phosphatase [Candidatus Uzinura diaspidicola str. ASNER]|uniref:Imidazoleglycerol-phosphate dehydratase n=1 Tax=Candidatus Uzinura diaspidicola str. ASNER TaxID=1133592 RepID=L7VMN3_9FLAO|nr:imidazole glycerol-phosphate dehydratase/histidinol phosphatase [Candidatus Uzinura diaspidicola str. ASNER]